MCPKVKYKQKGNMLVMAIFVMLVLSLLSFALVRMLTASNNNLVQEVYGYRALNAAQSGLDVAIAGAFALDGTETCSANISHNFVNAIGLEDCSFNASCQRTDVQARGIKYFRFTSTGTCTADNVVTSRTLSADAKAAL